MTLLSAGTAAARPTKGGPILGVRAKPVQCTIYRSKRLSVNIIIHMVNSATIYLRGKSLQEE